MKSKLYIQNCAEAGFTLLEMTVASFLGMSLLAMILTTVMSNRSLYTDDLVRTKINQNLRSALDIVGMNIRQAGENLLNIHPAVEVSNGASGAPDELILRRSILEEVLNVCVQIDAGTSSTDIVFAIPGTTEGCIYADNTHNYDRWHQYLSDHGNSTLMWLYDTTINEGEFVSFVGDSDTGTQYSVRRGSGTWQNTYTVGGADAIILEQWRFRLNNGVLQLIVNDDADSEALNVVDGIDDFQVRILYPDGTWTTSLARTDDWTQIEALEITITGSEEVRGRTIASTLSSRFFPRNILSN